MAKYLFVITFLLYPLLLPAQNSGSIIDEHSGVEFVFVPESKNIFPRTWMRTPINGTWKNLDEDEFERTAKVLKRALSKYPAKWPQQYVQKIYVFDYLQFYGVSYGGTYHEGNMYITNGGEEAGYTDYFLEGTFHHEFSSLILNDNFSLFDERGWKKVNPGKFFYYDEDYGGAGAIMTGRSSLEFSDSLNAIGFLNEYSQSTLENDFNEFARNLFLGGYEFWARVERYPVLEKKLSRLMDLYAEANPYFTREYFYTLKN